MVYPRECPIAHLKRMLQLGEVFSGCCRSHWIIVLVKRSIPTDLPPSCFITESGILMFTTITCKSISSFISVVFALCILDLKVLHSICQQIWKTQQWPQVSFHPNSKERQCQKMLKLLPNCTHLKR